MDRFEVSFDGATLVGEAGGFGLPVVFLHPDVADRRVWAGQMAAAAAEGFHVVGYDRRGFGESRSPERPFAHLDDLEGLLDRLSMNAVILVGAGEGGALAIDFAIENPDRTIGLVLVGTEVSGAPEPDLPEEIEELLDTRSYAAERGQWTSVNRIDAHLWLDGPLENEGRVEGEAREAFLEMNGARLQRPAVAAEEPDSAEPGLTTITAPTLLVVGGLDFPHIVERHEELEEVLENAFAVVLEGTAHLPMLESPERFDPLLLEFLEALSGGGEDAGDD